LILYYITDRTQFPGNAAAQRRSLLAKIAEAATADVDYIQLREKDLPTRELEGLAHEAMALVEAARQKGSRTRLLINTRSDVALACRADGVHLTSTDISAGDARALWMTACPQRSPVIGVSCHAVDEVQMAFSQGADFAVLAPIFGKPQAGVNAIGVGVLSEACGAIAVAKTASFPVLALGGISTENAPICIAAGAAGVAGIRLFQERDVQELSRRLREES
jgi:thiamine-phosphate pyrophosphorylase